MDRRTAHPRKAAAIEPPYKRAQHFLWGHTKREENNSRYSRTVESVTTMICCLAPTVYYTVCMKHSAHGASAQLLLLRIFSYRINSPIWFNSVWQAWGLFCTWALTILKGRPSHCSFANHVQTCSEAIYWETTVICQVSFRFHPMEQFRAWCIWIIY